MVMICIDQFSKVIKLVPLQESDAHSMTDKFQSTVASQHGLPQCIISDHDLHFHGYFWDEVKSLLDRTFTFSTALYPQIDGVLR